MRVLGIDTATKTASVCLLDDKGIVGEHTLHVEQVHSKKIMPMIERMLKDVGVAVSDIDGIAVSSGPGSFTGLRIGMSTAKGLAYTLKIPIVGVSTLESLAFNAVPTQKLVCPILDARMKEVYSSLYRWENTELIKLKEEKALSLENLLSGLQDYQEPFLFVGEGAVRFFEDIQNSSLKKTELAPMHTNINRASSTAILGRDRISAGKADQLMALQPSYLRRSQAEVAREKKGNPNE